MKNFGNFSYGTEFYSIHMTLFMNGNKILFGKCIIGNLLRFHASHFLIRKVAEHPYIFGPQNERFSGFGSTIFNFTEQISLFMQNCGY